MLSILIVEDDAEKRERVADVVRKAARTDAIEVHFAVDLQNSVRLLTDRFYDLVVLDLSIPSRMDRGAEPDGGLRLLDELDGPRGLRRPSHLVGLTAYPQLVEAALGKFAQRLSALLLYSPSSDDWAERLGTLVLHIAQAKTAATSGSADPDYRTFLAVLCALDTPELRSLRRLPWSFQQQRVLNDHTIYFVGSIVTENGDRHEVVAAAARHMGVAASATLAAKMIEVFSPRYFAMTGIAAATSREVANIGDVLVPDPAWEWSSGKLVGGDAGSNLLAAPRQLHLKPGIRNLMSRFAEDARALETIRSDWEGPSPDRPLSVRIGPVATGPSVVADAETVRRIQQQHRKVIGIDMEAYAIFSAAEEARHPQPTPIVMKSVVDYADQTKSDDYHAFAAYTSSRALRAFVERYLLSGEPQMAVV